VLRFRTGMLDAKKGAIAAVGEISPNNYGASRLRALPRTDPPCHSSQKRPLDRHPRIKREVAAAVPSLVTAVVADDHKKVKSNGKKGTSPE